MFKFAVQFNDKVRFIDGSLKEWHRQGADPGLNSWSPSEEVPPDSRSYKIANDGFLTDSQFDGEIVYFANVSGNQLISLWPSGGGQPAYAGEDGGFDMTLEQISNYFMTEILYQGAYTTMATDISFKTRALVSVDEATGITLNSNLEQSAAIAQEATLNNAFKSLTGNDLTNLSVQSTAEGTIVVFNGEGIHYDVNDEIILHCSDEMTPAIGKQGTFISALKSITGYPASHVGLTNEVELEPAV